MYEAQARYGFFAGTFGADLFSVFLTPELLELLDHALSKAGNPTLMTNGLLDTLVDHCAGNYRVLMTMSADLLAYGMAQEIRQLDEKFYLEVFQPKLPRPAAKKKVRG